MSDPPIANSALFADIRNLIDTARHRSAVALNAGLIGVSGSASGRTFWPLNGPNTAGQLSLHCRDN